MTDASNDRKRSGKYEATVENRLRAVECMEKGIPAKVVAKMFQTRESTVKSWMRKNYKEKMIRYKDRQNEAGCSMKSKITARNPLVKNVDEAIWVWYTQHKTARVAVHNGMIQAQARYFKQLIGGDKPFNASAGWLNTWKKRHGIVNYPYYKTELPFGIIFQNEYKIDFSKMPEVSNLSNDQIFSCSESTFYYDALPKRNSENKTTITNTNKVTVYLCCNASGSFKLPLVVFGLLKEPVPPEILKAVRQPMFQWMNASGMTLDLFEAWFREQFVPLVTKFLKDKGLPPSALLIMDSCLSHPKQLEKDDIKAITLNVRMTVLPQVIDINIGNTLRKLYRFKLMTAIIEAYDEGVEVSKYVKNIRIETFVPWLIEAWIQLSPESIQEFWQMLLDPDVKVNSHREETPIKCVESILSETKLLETFKNEEYESKYDPEKCKKQTKCLVKQEFDEQNQMDIDSTMNGYTNNHEKEFEVKTEEQSDLIPNIVEMQSLPFEFDKNSVKIDASGKFTEILQQSIEECQQISLHDVFLWLNEASSTDKEEILSDEEIVSIVVERELLP